MAESLGENKMLYIQESSGNDWVHPIACITSNVFSESAEFVGTTTRDNAGWDTSKPISQGYGVSFSGVSAYSLAQTTSYSELQTLKRNKVLIVWAIIDLEEDRIDYGRGYISSLSESAPVDDFAMFDGEIVGYGQPYSGVPTPTISTITSSFIGAGNYGVTVNFTASDDPVNIWGRLYTVLPTTSGINVYHDGTLETVSAPVQATISDGFAYYTTADNGTSTITIRVQLDTDWLGPVSNGVSHNVS